MAADLFADRVGKLVGKEAPVRRWTKRAGRVGKRIAGIRAQLDVGGGDVELELLDAGRTGNGAHTRQADQPGQRHLSGLRVDLLCDIAQRLQQRLDAAQIFGAEQRVRRTDAPGTVVEAVL